MEQRTPEGLTAPRRKSPVTDDGTAATGHGWVPVISRIPPLKPSAEPTCGATERPRPAGSGARQAAPEFEQDCELQNDFAAGPANRDAGDANADFAAATRCEEPAAPTNVPTDPPPWLTQLNRWQWNNTLLAVLVVLLSGIIITTWRNRPNANPPTQLAAPTIHYHLEPGYLPGAGTAEATRPTSHPVHNATLPDLAESDPRDQRALVALAAQTEPASRQPEAGSAASTADTKSQSAGRFECVAYPETEYPAYAAPAVPMQTAVRLDGQIQEYK